MDTSIHNIEGLFIQLGLASSEQDIEAFYHHNQLPNDTPLARAGFWSSSQAQFIHEAIDQDSDWAEVVDQLNAQLRG